MRKGDPANASSSKTWTGTHKPFASPVIRSVDGLHRGDAPAHVAQASNQGTAAAVASNQSIKGNFNTGNGGKWPTAKPNF